MSMISFVVPLYNHLEQTKAMLCSLQATLGTDLDYEIIFVDDASSDGTQNWLQSLDDLRIRTVFNPANIGYAGSTNAGVRLAQGPLLGLLNNDLLFEPGWLEPMLALLFLPGFNTGLVGNVQYRVADGKLDHAGVCLNAQGQFVHIQQLADTRAGYIKASAVTGACMLLRKEDFDAQGGFDEHFINGCEDIDLCFKLRAAGKFIYVATGSRIRHHVSLSRQVNTLNNERNSRYLFARWRREIKCELSAIWAELLQAGPASYAGKLSGQFTPSFLATSHAA
ncbi:MAG: glycosyltransferase, partial [Gammaproteobacteria bacterium]|nr:glycosyltransferase [Gammaproteobacteria bacterium]